MEFNVLCSEGQVYNYPFEKPCRTNMPPRFQNGINRCAQEKHQPFTCAGPWYDNRC